MARLVPGPPFAVGDGLTPRSRRTGSFTRGLRLKGFRPEVQRGTDLAQPATRARLATRLSALALPVLVLIVLLPQGAGATTAAAQAAGETVVSLTFDDGTASQYVARSVLAAHGMHGTFYVNSGRLDTDDSYYMTWAQVHGLADDGNEIGGHTSHHVNVTQSDPTETQRQICTDRSNLLAAGFQVTNFAYPYGANNAASQAYAQACGYNSARTTSQIASPPVESIPPPNPYATRIAGSGNTATSLAMLQSYVTQAEQAGGGWVTLVFHQICDACDPNSITLSDFVALVDWLEQRSANGTVVKTVDEVVGGPVQAAVPGPQAPPPPNGTNALRNASLEQDSDFDQGPECWTFDSFGTASYFWSRTTDAHSGTRAERVDVTNYVSGDSKLTPTPDLGYCTPSVTPGRRYRLTAWYKSNAPVNFAAFTRDNLGAFSFWDSSPDIPASSSWALASWVTPPIPNGANGLTFGLTLSSNGFLTVDDLGFDDSAPTGGGDTTPPTVSLTEPSNGAVVAGNATLSANAADNLIVDHVEFLVDGSLAGSASIGSPYTFSWNSRVVMNGSHTVRARAVDTAGNSTLSNTVTVTVANSSTNLLQNPSLESASGSTPTCWLLGGYGTNTFTWTRSSDAHSGSFGEKLDVTSLTNGDRKFVSVQDTGGCAPAAVPGRAYTVSAWYKSPSLGARFFAYYRNSAGTWTYWAQSTPRPAASSWTETTWTTPAVPAGATRLSLGLGLMTVGSVTMDDFTLVDNTPPPDMIAPTSTIRCNDSEDVGCGTGWQSGPVQVTLEATDNPDGYGVKEIRFTTDGTTPTATSGTVYSGPFSVSATTTIRYRAIDNAGNLEAVRTQAINIDTTAPQTTISCNGGSCGGTFPSSVSVTLAATDAASGVAGIRYTTDGSDPTATSGLAYLGAFSVVTTSTVKYRAFDQVGNAEAVKSQVVTIDGGAPSVSVTSPQSGAVLTGTVTLQADASDDVSVDHVDFLVDGQVVGTDSTSPYSVAWDTSTVGNGAHSITARAVDGGNNATTSAAVPVTVGSGPGDTTPPTTTIACNLTACASVYVSDVQVTLTATDNTGGSGVKEIRYTTDGTTPTATTGIVYSGAFTVSTTTTVKYRAFDNADNAEAVNSQLIQIDPTAPTVTVTSPTSGATLSGVVVLSANASDDGGVDHVDFLVDGQTVGSDSSAPYSVSWNSAQVSDGSHTIRARAVDTVGNSGESADVPVTVTNQNDTTPPTTTISCNSAACVSFYSSPVSVTLVAADNQGGSGVSQIRYTTNGTNPTATTGIVYSGAFTVSTTTTVKFRAFDNAGNGEAVQSQLIQLETVAPSSAISCNGAPCSSSYYTSAVTVSLSATDNVGGSGVKEIRYTTDGSDPTATTGTVYAAPFSVASTTTVKYRAFDNAGNAEAVNAPLIRVDTSAPSSAISCNGAACAAAYAAAVTVSLSATDTGGSGLKEIRYTTNGSDPTTTTGTVYSAPFSVASTTTVKYRAFDNAGNAETVRSTTIQLDTSAPSATLTSPTAGATVSGTVTLAADASDNVGIDRVEFQVDGTTVGSDTSAPYTFDWDSTSAANGSRSIRARSVDGAGNATNSSAVSVTVVNGSNLLQNPSLETASGSTPTCWLLGGYGTNTFAWTRTSDAHSGSFGEKLDITALTNGDRKLVSIQDTGACAPVGVPGKTYTVTVWYKSPALAAIIFGYYRNSSGSWVYWAQSARFAAAANWTQASWTTPALPAGATHISVGMGLQSVGSLAMDDFSLVANG